MTATRQGLAAILPTFGLRIVWDDLELRLPDDADLIALADVAADGVHDPDAAPFLRQWTRGTAEEVRRRVLTHHWEVRTRIDPDRWRLGFGVYRNGEILGLQAVSAENFAIARSAQTGSWLGRRHHGNGIGTRMRLMVLHLAFEGLDAMEMISEAFTDNPASNRISTRLGYALNGTYTIARDGQPATENRYLMTRSMWEARPEALRPPIKLDGVAPVRELLGITDSAKTST
jgi:RimJ/RimL family protein N-acetyltransferase